MTIILVSLSAHGEDEIAVNFELEQGEKRESRRLVISVADCADLGLRTGECTPEVFDAVEYAASLHDAVKRGLYVLSFGRCSQKRLIQKLRQKGFSSELATEASEELCRLGYVDSVADALAEAERGISKLWGRGRIVASLREKGYPPDAVKEALACLEEDGVDYEENCAVLIRRRWGQIPTEPAERSRIVAALMRYGYTSSEIRSAARILEK